MAEISHARARVCRKTFLSFFATLRRPRTLAVPHVIGHKLRAFNEDATIATPTESSMAADLESYH